MKTGIKIAGGLLPLVLLAVVLVACENDMDVLTPSDAVMNIWANPASIVLDPTDTSAPRDERGKLIGSTTVFTQLFDKNGYPLENHVVYFSTDAGKMGSQGPPGAPPTPVETDANGIARDSLTVPEDAPATVKVTAQSSQITKQVTVAKQLLSCTPLVVLEVVADPTSGLLRHCSTATDQACTADPPTSGTCPTGQTCCPTGQTCSPSTPVAVTLTATITDGLDPSTGDPVYTFDCGSPTVIPDVTDNEATCTYNATGTFSATVTVEVPRAACIASAVGTASITIR